MSTGFILLKKCLFYSVETRNICTSVSQIENFILSNSTATINNKVVDKLFEVVVSLKDYNSREDFYSIETVLQDGCEVQSKLVAKSVEETKHFYSAKHVEEVAQEIHQIFSIFYENVKILKNTVSQVTYIERVLSESVSEILIETLKQILTVFEANLFLRDLDTLSDKEQQVKMFSKSICDAFGEAFVLVLELENNKTIREDLNGFIRKNGIITVEDGKTLIQDSVLPFYQKNKGEFYIKDKLKGVFDGVVKNNVKLSNNIIMRIAEYANNKNSSTEDFIDWAIKKIQKNQCEDFIVPYLIYTSSVFLFNIKFVKDKSLFNCCGIYFNTVIESFIKVNPFVVRLLILSLQEKLTQQKHNYKDVVLIEIVSIICTAILYYNAVLNGRVKKEEFYEMTRFEILKELSRDFSIIRAGEIFFTYNIEFHRLIADALFGVKKHSIDFRTGRKVEGVFNQEQTSREELKVVFDVIFNDLEVQNELVNILEEIYNVVITENIQATRTPEVIPSDKDLSLMLMFAVSEKAEKFIAHSYSPIEKELLEQQSGSSRLLKIDLVFKSFLTTTFLSKLAKAIYISRNNKDIPDEGVQLKLVEAFKEAFVFYDILSVSKEDILDKIQEYILRTDICNELASIKELESNNFIKNLQARFISYSKEKTILEADILLSDAMKEACACKNTVNSLVLNFCKYVCFNQLKEVTLLRLRVYNFIQEQLFGLIKKDFIKEFKSLSEQYLLLNPCELKTFSRLVQPKGGSIIIKRAEFGTEQQIEKALSFGFENKITLLICSIMLMVWAKGQGLIKLEEKQQLSSSEVLLEVFSADEYLKDGLQEFFLLNFSLSNKYLYLIAEKLNDSKDMDKDELVSIFSYFSGELKQPQQEELFVAIFKGLGICLKKTRARNELKKEKKAKAEQSRLDRIKQQKAQKEEREKQKVLLQDRGVKVEERYSGTVFQDDEIESKNMEESILDNSTSSYGSVLEEQIQDLSIDDDNEILQYQTLDEVLYDAQALAIEELEAEFDGFSDRERALLLRYSSKMKSSALEKAYKKGVIDNENQRKEQRFIASWGTKYKFQDIEAEEGAAAPINIEYTIIQSKAFVKWLEKRNPRIQEDIERRFTKAVIEGDLGDVRALNSGDLGAYEFKFRDSCLTRIYYVPKGKNIYILCGGDKSDQGRTIVERLPILVAELKKAIEI